MNLEYKMLSKIKQSCKDRHGSIYMRSLEQPTSEKVGGWEPGAGRGRGVRGGLEGGRVSICPHDPRGRSGAASDHTGHSRGMS